VDLSSPIRPPLGISDAVLFDMDGTLLFLPVDIDALRRRLTEFHQQYGLDITFRPLTDDMDRAEAELRRLLPPAEARAASQWARAQVAQAEVDAAEAAQARQGLVDALAALRHRDVRIGVVSNNTRRGIRAGLQAVGIEPDQLQAVVSREDVDRPKPAPDAVERAVRMLVADGWDPADGRLVYVGDAPSDLIAVRALDIERVHPRMQAPIVLIVGGGRAGGGSLVGPGADSVVPDDRAAHRFLVE